MSPTCSITAAHIIAVERKPTKKAVKPMDKKCPLEMYFKDGDCVRYKAPKTDVYWHASYCSRGKCLITDDLEVYNTLSTFAKHSLRKARPTRKTSEVNGWTKCEVQVDGKWVPAKTLRE